MCVHGHHNCFVVSTAAWPTVGTVNPTLTLAALSLRAVEGIHRVI
jgi:choline dehydrogenase-like flavoprotein